MQYFKRITLAAFAGILLMAAPTLRAEKSKGRDHGAGHWDKFDMLKKKLDLSDSQVSRLKDADKGQRQAAKLLMDKAEADKASLKVLVDEKASETDLTAALNAMEADHKALKEGAEKKIELLRSILSPLQQAKMVLMMQNHRGHWDGMDGGWQGHQGMKGMGAHCGMGGGHGMGQSDVPDNR